jgi:hypothetical protein
MPTDAQPGATEPLSTLAPVPPASGLPRLMDPSKVRFDLLRELRETQTLDEPADYARALAFAEAAIALAQELGAWPPSPEQRFARLEGKIAMRKIMNDPRLTHPPGPRA